MAGARLGKVAPGSSILFLCDMQERFRPSVAFFPQIVAVAARMLQHGGAGRGGRAARPARPRLRPALRHRDPGLHPEHGAGSAGAGPGRARGGGRLLVPQVERLVALGRLRQSGAFLSTSESLVLQLLRDAAHPRFRQVQQLIKEPAPDSGLLGLQGLLGGPGGPGGP
ncbi:isochorismatase domain-containing protein 2 isoform X3 [Dromaius novaehollandiae]|uniref:isochorismatase domain-containing protein 2 isoform X3 n=1 Tax=Dromaius novaehollandiae TaxID=8790 RepID=UPI00311EE31F